MDNFEGLLVHFSEVSDCLSLTHTAQKHRIVVCDACSERGLAGLVGCQVGSGNVEFEVPRYFLLLLVQVTRLLKCGNHRVFGKDLEHHLADLEHTQGLSQ